MGNRLARRLGQWLIALGKWLSRPQEVGSSEGEHSVSGSGWIAKDDIVNRLRLRSNTLIDDLYKAATSQLETEDKRDAVLTGKATSLLTSSGLSLTVAFTFGGFLLEHPEHISGLGSLWSQLTIAAFGLCLLLGLTGSLMALLGLRIAKSEGVNEEVVFSEVELSASEKAWEEAYATQSDKDPRRRIDPDTAAASRYKRYLVAHYWGIYQSNFERLEKKASKVALGQHLFFAFVALLILIGLTLAISAFREIRLPHDEPHVSTVRCELVQQARPGTLTASEPSVGPPTASTLSAAKDGRGPLAVPSLPTTADGGDPTATKPRTPAR